MNLYFFILKNRLFYTYLLNCSLVSVLASQLYGKINDDKNHSFYYIESYIASKNVLSLIEFTKYWFNVYFIAGHLNVNGVVVLSLMKVIVSSNPVMFLEQHIFPLCFMSVLLPATEKYLKTVPDERVTLNSELIIIQWFLNPT